MKLADLLIRIRTEGMELAKRSIQQLGDEAQKSERKTSSLGDVFSKFGELPGPIGEVASRLSDLGSQARAALSAIGGAASVIGGTAAAQTSLAAATVKTATALGATATAATATSSANAALTSSSLAAASATGALTAAQVKFREENNRLARTVYRTARDMGLSVEQARALRNEFTRPLKSAFEAVNPTKTNLVPGLQTATSAVQALGLRLAALGGVAAVVAGSFQLIGSRARAAADALDEQATRLGITVEEFERLNLITQKEGGSTEAVVRVYDKLSRSLRKLDEDNAQTRKSFELLGLNIDDLVGKSEREVAAIAVKNWKLLGQTMEATAAISSIIGPNFRELSVAIQANGERIGEYEALLVKYGAVASRELIEKGRLQGDALDELGLAWKGLSNEVGTWTGDMVTSLTNWLATSLNSVREFLGAIRGARDELAAQVARGEDTLLTRLFKGFSRNALYDRMGVTEASNQVKEVQQQQLKDLTEIERITKRAAAAEAARLRERTRTVKTLEQERAEAEKAKAAAEARRKQEEERKRFLEEQVKAGEALAKTYNDLFLQGEQARGQDVQRVRLQSTIREQLSQINGLTEEQKRLTEESYLAIYDQNQAYQQQLDSARLITEEYNRQYELTLNIQRESNKTIKDAQREFEVRNQTRQEREADQRRRAVLSNVQAAIDTAQQEISGVQDIVGPLSPREQAYIDARKQLIEQLQEQLTRNSAAVNELNNQVLAVESSIDEGVTRGLTSALDAIPTLAEGVSSVIESTSSALKDGLFDLFTTGKFNVQDFFRTLLSSILDLFIQLTLIKPLLDYFRSTFSSVGGGGTVSSIIGAIFSAKGNAFDKGKVVPFARGGIVNEPTLFPLKGKVGVMGEAGPEAVLPLTRGTDGKLGVQAVGGGSSYQQVNTINIVVNGGQTNEETGSVVSEAVVRAMKGIVKQTLVEERRVGGMLASA